VTCSLSLRGTCDRETLHSMQHERATMQMGSGQWFASCAKIISLTRKHPDMAPDARDQDAYMAGAAAAQDLDALTAVKLVERAAAALVAYLDLRELLFGRVEREQIASIASSFCAGFFATLDLVAGGAQHQQGR
jgi:hypothetical protein